MYFDAVLDDNMYPVFNGTPEEVRAWLLERADEHFPTVCPGKTMRLMTVAEYLAG